MTTEILILVILILANSLFSLSEMSVVSARKVRLQRRAEKGNRGARTAMELAQQPTRFLSTVQIGITLIGILSGAFGGATIAEQLAVYFSMNDLLAPYSEAIGVVIVVVVVTYLSLVVGELVPKRVALNNADGIASAIAPSMLFISKLATPLVSLLSSSTEILLRLLSIKPGNEPSVTEEEVKMLIDEGRRSGVFEHVEQTIVERVFRLSDRTVNSIMTHRSEIVWLDVKDPYEINMQRIVSSGHTNFIVSEHELDHVVGIARAKDLLAEYQKGHPASLTFSSMMPPFVPEGMKALDVVERLRDVKSPMALVVDEYGTVAGMVTLLDILEAIVGDIPGVDLEGEEPEAFQRDDGSWLLDGMLSADELKLYLGLDVLPEEDADYDTVSGLFMAQLGRIPRAGDKFEWQNLIFEVMDMDGHRVDKALVTPIQAGG